ncbi:MAG: wax ester/triacylglycerol synthase family O-acyltransferase [Actinobacteria bacterium]|nr:wax ester/triacylglycerol synthase family O-acyltransferase [Actinomycetota bacterium]
MVADRLTGLDASFLHLERSGAHMHVASTSIFEGPAPSHEEFRNHIAARLHLVPRFRQKLRFVPLDQGRPVWVDDPYLNLDYHVRQTALPAPGSDEQLRNLAARIFSQQLDRSKPLWELWLVEGLDDGRFAIIGKSHHALVDGISGVDITTVLFDLDPQPDPPPAPPPPWLAQPEPTDFHLFQEALRERLTSPREIARGARYTMRGPRKVLRGIGATTKMVGAGFSAPSSVFNVEIGPHRRFAMTQADLDDLKRIKNAHGGTVNDVILAIVAGGIGRYLRARGRETEGVELRAMVPVSVRAADERGALGNRITAMMAPLPVGVEDPVERLALVSAAMGDLKASGQAVGAEILTKLTDFAPTTIASQAARLQPAQRFFNLVVTNVPGPQFPLYLLGRRMESIFPMVPLAHKQALCIGIMSYDGQVNFGLIGDYDAMADLQSFALDLEEETAEAIASAAPAPDDPARARAAASTNGAAALAGEPS